MRMAARHRSVPSAAKWLGGLGAIPFVVCAGGIALAPPELAVKASDALVIYGAVILSFLGGMYILSGEVQKGSPYMEEAVELLTTISNPRSLAIALFDRGTTGILFIHNVGVEAALWSVGLMILAGRGEPGAWKKFLNMPLLAVIPRLDDK